MKGGITMLLSCLIEAAPARLKQVNSPVLRGGRGFE